MRCDSAAMVANTSELLPDPDTPVNTVIRRFGISTEMFFRLFSRAPATRITSWLSARSAGRTPGCETVEMATPPFTTPAGCQRGYRLSRTSTAVR